MIAKVFNTRIEIAPYETGDLPMLEKRWSAYDVVTHSYNNIACLREGDKLIIPKGQLIGELQNLTKKQVVIMNNSYVPEDMDKMWRMKVSPRNAEQTQVINFMLSESPFERNALRSQLIANMGTGFGKTYCAINAMINMHYKTIIVCHSNDVKTQWYKNILKYTTIKPYAIKEMNSNDDFNIDNIDNDVDIYLTTHGLFMHAFANNEYDRVSEFFNAQKFGLKIVDEVHLMFHNTLMIDFHSDIPKNIYLTATMGRSDVNENRIFDFAFSDSAKYQNVEPSRKHVEYQFVFYNSLPNQHDKSSIRTAHGFSSYRFAEYAFDKDDYKTLEGVIYKILDKCLLIEGRILLVVPKIENMEYLHDKIQKRYPDISSGIINSKQKADDKKYVRDNCRIIISSIKSLGTGSDIKGLRNLIIAEPFGSKIIANQLIGRLREYSSTENTYAYELVDSGFPTIIEMINRKFYTIQHKCISVTRTKIT